MKNKILIIGSSNTDMVVKTKRFPQPGETIIGGEFFMFPGGKGANQAVAAARLGGNVIFLSKLGDDIFGHQALKGLREEGINVDLIHLDSAYPSGVALITVNAKGENEIVVAPGANHQLKTNDIDRAYLKGFSSDIILLQLEIPIDTVEYAVEKAFAKRKKVVLNPAPAQPISDTIYPQLYLITPNETEAGILTGIQVTNNDKVQNAAEILFSRGVKNVIITLGAKGAYFKNADQNFFIDAPKVEAVDTTAAGDVFNGALCVALAQQKPWKTAIEFAIQTASVSVTRLGAQASIPYLREL